MQSKPQSWITLAIVIAITCAAYAANQEPAPSEQQIGPSLGALWPFGGKKRKKPFIETPTPSPSPSPVTSPGASGTPETIATATPSPVAKPKQTPAPNATISTDDISDYENNLPEARKIIDVALGLTSVNLDYRYGSADPTNGGMDCSGFVYYVLTKCGVPEVPRDAREQYIWVRKAGNFQAVLAQSDDTFELNALQPGDLLFWGDMNSSSREPAITQSMIYVGRERGSSQRIMVGAIEAGNYKDQPRSGVSVVDFKVQRADAGSDNPAGPRFVGYGRVPGLTTQ